ncbi:MAG: NnrS family protein, partial [Gammaproteobacteria bacterium]|nr:NnrS family protein [Gammaproteobacteria bacterium]
MSDGFRTAGARPHGSDTGAPRWSVRSAPLWTYGFRPFFLLGAAWVPVALAGLLLALAGAVTWPGEALPPFRWHGHEMIFGFVAAAVAGFLLTAVPTWTGTRAVSGWALAALAALWVLGRVVVAPPVGLYATPAVLLDLLFFPVLAAVLGVPLIARRNFRNLPFLIILALLFVSDLLFHGLHGGWIGGLPFDPLRLAADLVMVLIVVVGGRIVPAFTRNALVAAGRGSSITPAPALERAAIAAVVAVVAVDVLAPQSVIAGAVAAVAALLIAARLARWEGRRALDMPIVWILHAGYAWVPLALALKALQLLTGAPWASGWLHALTAGA